MVGLSDTTMGRTSSCMLSSACHQDQDSAVLGVSPTSGLRRPQDVTNTGTAPLSKKKGITGAWCGDKRIFLFITWLETVAIHYCWVVVGAVQSQGVPVSQGGAGGEC